MTPPVRFTPSLRLGAVVAALVMTLGCGLFSSKPGEPTDPPTTSTSLDPTSTPSPEASATEEPTPEPTVSPAATNPSVHVSAVKSSYTGLCPPPSDATRFKAVISVPSGPATVKFRWTTSNGGDTDPSTQTVTFPSGGAQSKTVYHNESFYPPGPYPATKNDWVAVKFISPITSTSNHVNLTVKCVPFTVAISGVVTNYSGHCPPPATGSTAITLSGVIKVSLPMDVKFHWRSSNGGDSDPSSHTVHIVPGTPYTFHHYESFYPPGPYPATKNDWIAVDAESASGPAYTAQSNHVNIKITCTS